MLISSFRKHDSTGRLTNFQKMFPEGAIPYPTKLSEVRDRYGLSYLLGIQDRGLRYILYARQKEPLYNVLRIAKRSGGFREIRAPNPRLKNIQRRLLRLIAAEYLPKDVIHGFAPGRSVKSNAAEHVRRIQVLNIDLKDFFPSINFGRVRGLFMAEPFRLPADVATVIAKITCFDNQLPQGAPTSPIISNLICRGLDSHLRRLATKANCRYTRYADDITISSGKFGKMELLASFSQSTTKLTSSLVKLIERHDFTINEAKVRLQGVKTAQIVTGLVTNSKVNVNRKFIRNVRAMLHNAEVGSVANCQRAFEKRCRSAGIDKISRKGFLSLLKGRIDFIGHIRGKDDHIYLNLISRLIDLDPSLTSASERARVKLITDEHHTLLDSLWVVDSLSPKPNDLPRLSTGIPLRNGGILTCAHSARKDDRVVIHKRTGDLYQAATVDFLDEQIDLAILCRGTVFDGGFDLADVFPNISDEIILAGFPHFSSTNLGIVERGKIIGEKASVDQNPRLIVSTPILEGNSGGPIFNLRHEIIGVAAKGNTSLNRDGDSNQPEAIPLECILQFLEDARIS